MTTIQKLNCKKCMKGLHQECADPGSCFCAENKHYKKDGSALQEQAQKEFEKINIDDVREKTIELNSLAKIEDPKLANSKIKTKAVVSSNTISYSIPKRIHAQCLIRKDKHDCPGERIIDLEEKELVQLVDVNDFGKDRMLKDIARKHNFRRECDLVFADCELSTIKRIRLRPAVASLELINDKIVDDEGNEWKSFDTYMLQDVITPLEAGREIEVLGRVIADPKNQKVTLFISQVKLTASLDFDTEKINELKSFFNNKTTKEIINWITDEFSKYSKIKKRENITIAGMLAYFSSIYLKFDGKLIPAWVKATVIGDTRTAKSETVRQLISLLKAGQIITGETASTKGLAGAASQSQNNQWFIEWGPLVLQDRRLLAVDGAHKLRRDQWDELAEAESSGKVIITKAGKGEAPARTRQIKIMNPLDIDFRTVRSMDSFFYPVQSIQNNLQIQSIARQDQISFVTDNIKPEERNVKNIQTYDSRLECLQELLNLVWNQKFNIIFNDDAVNLILEKATDLERNFKFNDIPLITNDQKYKLAKLSASLAALTCSFNDDFTELIITKDHVDFIVDFIQTEYHIAGLDILAASHMKDVDADFADEVLSNIEKALENKEPKVNREFCKNIVIWIAKQQRFTKEQLYSQFELADKNEGRPLIAKLQTDRIIDRKGTFIPTRAGVELGKLLLDEKKGYLF